MRFRAVINEHNAMRDFTNIITCLSKLAKESIIRITPENIYFIISEEDNGPRRPFIWCELPNTYYFKEYDISGVSEEANEIYLSFSPVMFAKSLYSIRMGAKSLKIKLTNKHIPCLTLEIEMAVGEVIQNRVCIHDIPVEIISRKHWPDYTEPKFQEFHITLQMPAMKSIRNIVDRMKTMSQYLIVSANRNGRVTLKIETNMVNLSAHFPNLTVQSFTEGVICDDDDSEMTCMDPNETKCQIVSACIDIRKFVSFLTAMHITNNRIICSIVHGKMVKLLLENPGVMSLQCFLTEVSP